MDDEYNFIRFRIFLKGILMGLADIVPGISSGTIALITNIYEELIDSINSINPLPFLYSIFKRDWKRSRAIFKGMNLGFLINLGLGMVTSFLIASKFITNALNNFPVFTYGFFFGLIFISAIKIFEEVESNNGVINAFFLILGALIAFYVTGLDSFLSNHSIAIIFFGGGLAITAMLLPGVSGSFMLLMIGQYEYMLEAIQNIKARIVEILVFLLGAIISLFLFADLLSYLLDNYKNKVFGFLTGLMVGALRLPAERIVFVSSNYPELDFRWNLVNIILTSLFILLGGLFVYLIEE